MVEEGVELGYDTYTVPFGTDTISAIYALGFAVRSALTFGGMKGGMAREILLYNKERVFAFVLALGEVDLQPRVLGDGPAGTRRIGVTMTLAITTALVVVLGGQERAQSELSPPLAVAVVSTTEHTTTTMVHVLDAFIGLHPDDEAFLAALEENTDDTDPTATTTTVATTTTASRTQPAPRPTTTTTTATTSTTAAPSGEFRSDYEAEFFSKINSLRAAKGLPALVRDGSLNSRARDWSKKMAKDGQLSHSNLKSLIPPWSRAGENVGQGGSVSSIFSALTGSRGHLSNMLEDFTHGGIGVWVDSKGVVWTTHVFAR